MNLAFSARTSSPCRPLDRCFWSCWPPETCWTSTGWTSVSFSSFLTCTLRNWYPRPACGTAVQSVRISISVSGLAPVRDEPVECLPWTRRTGVCRTYPLPGYRSARSERRWPIGRENSDVCLIFGIPSWLMPLRDRSGQSGQPFR